MNIYKWLWSKWPGRPLAYWRRDFWHEFEIINIVFFVSIGFFSGLLYPLIYRWLTSEWWHPIALVATFYFIGVIQGHFWWGKRWIKGEKGA